MELVCYDHNNCELFTLMMWYQMLFENSFRFHRERMIWKMFIIDLLGPFNYATFLLNECRKTQFTFHINMILIWKKRQLIYHYLITILGTVFRSDHTTYCKSFYFSSFLRRYFLMNLTAILIANVNVITYNDHFENSFPW